MFRAARPGTWIACPERPFRSTATNPCGQAGPSGLAGLHHRRPMSQAAGRARRAVRVQGASRVDHLGDVVALGQAYAEESSAQVDVVGDVAATEVGEELAEVALA